MEFRNEDNFFNWLSAVLLNPGNEDGRLEELICGFLESEKEFYTVPGCETISGEQEIFCFTVTEGVAADGSELLIFDFSGECE